MAPTIEKSSFQREEQLVQRTPCKCPHHQQQQQQALIEESAFDKMLARLETAFSRAQCSVDVDELWRVLEDYKSTPSEWAKYAYYDMRKYKRNLVAEFDKFNVMIIGWGPNSRSCIHDHAGSHCFMKVSRLTSLKFQLISSLSN